MQGSFEKKVQEKLGELSVSPSAPVWEKVEMQIRPGKKRRRIAFWILFPVLLLGGAGWWLNHEDGDSSTAASTKRQQDRTINTRLAEKRQLKPEPLPPQQSPLPLPAASTIDVERRPAQKDEGLGKRTGASKPVVAAINATGEKSILRSLGDKQDNIALPTAKKATVTNAKDGQQATVQLPKEKQSTEALANVLLQQEKKQAVTIADSANGEFTSVKTPSLNAKMDSAAQSKKKLAQNKKWTKYIDVKAGWSSYQSALPADLFYATYSSATPGAMTNRYSTPVPKVRKGASFGFAVGAARSLGERFQLSAGLGYQYYSTHQKTGVFKAIDTVVNDQQKQFAISGYYGGPFDQDYTNRFHFIELPVTASYQLLRKLPLQINAEISLGRLLSTNALTTSSSGISYVSRENISKTVFAFSGGLQYRVMKAKNFSINLGPQFQHNLVPVQRQNDRAQSRLSALTFAAAIHF